MVILCTLVFLTVFERVISSNNWDEIKKGNIAVAMATDGEILGIATLFRASIGIAFVIGASID